MTTFLHCVKERSGGIIDWGYLKVKNWASRRQNWRELSKGWLNNCSQSMLRSFGTALKSSVSFLSHLKIRMRKLNRSIRFSPKSSSTVEEEMRNRRKTCLWSSLNKGNIQWRLASGKDKLLQGRKSSSQNKWAVKMTWSDLRLAGIIWPVRSGATDCVCHWDLRDIKVFRSPSKISFCGQL